MGESKLSKEDRRALRLVRRVERMVADSLKIRKDLLEAGRPHASNLVALALDNVAMAFSGACQDCPSCRAQSMTRAAAMIGETVADLEDVGLKVDIQQIARQPSRGGAADKLN